MLVGRLTYVGDQNINNIARFDGSAWHPFGDESGIRPLISFSPLPWLEMASMLAAPWDMDSRVPAAVLRWSQNTWNLLGSPVANGVGGTLATIAISGT